MSNLKIISLLPSATEIIAALGLSDALVGRSHECDFPPEVEKLPVCTEARLDSNKPSSEIDRNVSQLVQDAISIYQIKLDVIDQLQPTSIVTQDQCDVCAVSLAEVENALSQLTHTKPQVISLQPKVLGDIWDDIQRVAHAFNVGAEPLLDSLQFRVESCSKQVEDLPEEDIPTVAAIEWTNPLMSSGNWIPELITLAGGKSPFGRVGEHSPYLDWESLVKANPDYLIIMPCGFDLNRTRQEVEPLTQHSDWLELKAVQNGHVFITDGNAYFNRPGPRLADSLEILAEILHPELFNFGYEGTAWERLLTPVKTQ